MELFLDKKHDHKYNASKQQSEDMSQMRMQ